MKSPQRLRASGGTGIRPQDEVFIQGAKPFVNKSPWNPPAWSSPCKRPAAEAAEAAAAASTAASTGSCPLTLKHRLLAGQLAGLDIALAAELVRVADQQRRARVRRRVEHDLQA